jgi:hypothetical protein
MITLVQAIEHICSLTSSEECSSTPAAARAALDACSTSVEPLSLCTAAARLRRCAVASVCASVAASSASFTLTPAAAVSALLRSGFIHVYDSAILVQCSYISELRSVKMNAYS